MPRRRGRSAPQRPGPPAGRGPRVPGESGDAGASVTWAFSSSRKQGRVVGEWVGLMKVVVVTGDCSRAAGGRDDHVLGRDVLVATLVAGGHALDLVHDVHALDHLAEDAVADAVLR